MAGEPLGALCPPRPAYLVMSRSWRDLVLLSKWWAPEERHLGLPPAPHSDICTAAHARMEREGGVDEASIQLDSTLPVITVLSFP